MANESRIKVDDYDYKDLRKKLLDEYYRRLSKKKAMAKSQIKVKESMRRRSIPSDSTSSMPGIVQPERKESDLSSLAKGVEWRKKILSAEEKPKTKVAPSFTSK